MDKLKSRKFWMAVVTLFVAIIGGGGIEALAGAGQMDPLAIAVAGVVAVVYLFAQSKVDRTTALGSALQSLDVEKLNQLVNELKKLGPDIPPLADKPRGATDQEDNFRW